MGTYFYSSSCILLALRLAKYGLTRKNKSPHKILLINILYYIILYYIILYYIILYYIILYYIILYYYIILCYVILYYIILYYIILYYKINIVLIVLFCKCCVLLLV